MKMRRLYILLAAWSVAVIAPGALVELGLFGRIDMNTSITGSLILLWIVGYLVQFGLFMWIMNIVDNQKVLSTLIWWFVASLVPWGIDWTLPVSPLFVLLWLPIVIAIAGWIATVDQRDKSLQQHGIRATGVVLEVLKPGMNVVINNVYIKRKVRLRIEREDGAPAYEGILDGLFMLGEIPSVGDRIPLVVDPAKPQRFEYEQGTDATKAAQVVAVAPSTTSGGGIAEELEKLAKLRDRGAITSSEFEAAKRKLLK